MWSGKKHYIIRSRWVNPGVLWEFTQRLGSCLNQRTKFMWVNCVVCSNLNFCLYYHHKKSLTTYVYTVTCFCHISLHCSQTYCTNLTLMTTIMSMWIHKNILFHIPLLAFRALSHLSLSKQLWTLDGWWSHERRSSSVGKETQQVHKHLKKIESHGSTLLNACCGKTRAFYC